MLKISQNDRRKHCKLSRRNLKGFFTDITFFFNQIGGFFHHQYIQTKRWIILDFWLEETKEKHRRTIETETTTTNF